MTEIRPITHYPKPMETYKNSSLSACSVHEKKIAIHINSATGVQRANPIGDSPMKSEKQDLASVSHSPLIMNNVGG